MHLFAIKSGVLKLLNTLGEKDLWISRAAEGMAETINSLKGLSRTGFKELSDLFLMIICGILINYRTFSLGIIFFGL